MSCRWLGCTSTVRVEPSRSDDCRLYNPHRGVIFSCRSSRERHPTTTRPDPRYCFPHFFSYRIPPCPKSHFSLSTLTTLTFIFLSNSSFCCSVGTSPSADSICGEAVIPIPAHAMRPTPKRRRVRGERFLYELVATTIQMLD